MRRPGRARPRAGALLLSALLTAAPALVGCSTGDEPIARASGDKTSQGSSPSVTPGAPASTLPGSGGDFTVPDPGPMRGDQLTADLLVTSPRRISDRVRRSVAAVDGVVAVLPLSVAALSANGRTLTIAAADPGRFRRWTQPQTATVDAVWQRVAGGEVAVDPSVPRQLTEGDGYLRLGSTQDAPQLHIGAFAPLVRQISAVVNPRRAEQLGIPFGNALLVSTGVQTPSAVTSAIRPVLGPGMTMQTLALEFNVDVPQTAVLSGTSVSDRVGTFSYTPHADGTLTPQAGWVAAYIRRETVPILGQVTCNKGMLPQLRGALSEVVRQGLAASIHPGEYAGCYYPRFIGRDPAKGLSLHSWGIAVDLNVPGNQRGTVGQMDRRVVAIFKRWGFAWGGDWNYTDPMHFEMASVVTGGS
ncbi:MAG: M15 family metallopeptidase [Nocardioidaceae bacterium]